jgi:hypothetical protein
MLWKLVKAGEDRPLSAADLALLLRLRFALQEYEAKIGQGQPILVREVCPDAEK